MKELLVISGKGGTGKTSLTASFIYLAQRCIACDYDVDASNLPILLQPYDLQGHEFSSSLSAAVDRELCIDCGLCREVCRFDAVTEDFEIITLACEGCGFCVEVCPVDAITLHDRSSGRWFSSLASVNGRDIPLFHAELRPGEENSGKLVAQVKSAARQKAIQEGYDLLISDGSPGIGCPVISSLVGVNMAVVVAEPSVSGFHDLKRMHELLALRAVKSVLIINKSDLNPEVADAMEKWAKEQDIPCAARLPYSPELAAAVAVGDIPVSRQELHDLIVPVWDNIMDILEMTNNVGA